MHLHSTLSAIMVATQRRAALTRCSRRGAGGPCSPTPRYVSPQDGAQRHRQLAPISGLRLAWTAIRRAGQREPALVHGCKQAGDYSVCLPMNTELL